jgi:hypothetical protein
VLRELSTWATHVEVVNVDHAELRLKHHSLREQLD